MKWMILLMFVIMTTAVNAEYIDLSNICEDRNENEMFIHQCPPDHRIDGDWLKVRHYLVNESISYCVGGELKQDCPFEILPWNHPNVTGASISELTKTTSDNNEGDVEIPEFTAIGAMLAVIGGLSIYNVRRKKE